jgi:hypothetical protein
MGGSGVILVAAIARASMLTVSQPPMTQAYDLHGVFLLASSPDRAIRQRIERLFAPFAATTAPQQHAIRLHLRLLAPDGLASWQPAGEIVSASRLLQCALHGDILSAHFPRWGTVTVDLAAETIAGDLLPEALNHYGAFDDILIIVLGPLLRRRGFYSLHAFAASREGLAVLLVGDIGAGKTTTGLSLLEAGWKLISNDSPLLRQEGGKVLACAYPGLLAAHDDTLARFAALQRFQGDPGAPAAKRVFAAHEAFGGAIWQQQARVRLLLFPQIEPGLAASRAEPLAAPEALLALLPNSIERWDRDYISPYLAILRILVRQAPAYRLRLAPDVRALPGLVTQLLP